MAAPIIISCVCLSRMSHLNRMKQLQHGVSLGLVCGHVFNRYICINQQVAKQSGTNQGDHPADIPVEKLKITYSRSSGPGGQHVNKVNTKAEVRFHVHTAEWISQEVRNKIILQNKSRINKSGELIVTSEVSRSQQRNLEDCVQKLSAIISEASQRPTEPSEEDITLRAKRLKERNSVRLKEKKIHSATKQSRHVGFD